MVQREKLLELSRNVNGDNNWMDAQKVLFSDLVTEGELWEIDVWSSDDMRTYLFVGKCYKSIKESKVEKNYFIDLSNEVQINLDDEEALEKKMRPIEAVEKYVSLPKVDWR